MSTVPGPYREPFHYSPSLARASDSRTFWIDARQGCRWSNSDRQKLREKLAQRDDDGRVVDRFPKWLAHTESRRETKIKANGRKLFKEHLASVVEPDRSRIGALRFEVRRIELEMMIATGESGKALELMCADIPGFTEKLKELVRLSR